DEPEFSTLSSPRFDEYADWFAAIGLKLVKHEREFFYFEPENGDTVPDSLPRIALFCYILIDDAANQGQASVEEFVFGQNFLLTSLPHFTRDRYTALLRQLDLHDVEDLRTLLKHMECIGWIKCVTEEEFRFLRPFHRVFSKCIDLAQQPIQENPSPNI